MLHFHSTSITLCITKHERSFETPDVIEQNLKHSTKHFCKMLIGIPNRCRLYDQIHHQPLLMIKYLLMHQSKASIMLDCFFLSFFFLFVYTNKIFPFKLILLRTLMRGELFQAIIEKREIIILKFPMDECLSHTKYSYFVTFTVTNVMLSTIILQIGWPLLTILS